MGKERIRYFNLYTCFQHNFGLFISVTCTCALFSDNGKPSLLFAFVKDSRVLDSVDPSRLKPIFEII